MSSFWRENPEWAARGPKAHRPPPRCQTHGVEKVRQTTKTPYRCPECEREVWERGEPAQGLSKTTTTQGE